MRKPKSPKAQNAAQRKALRKSLEGQTNQNGSVSTNIPITGFNQQGSSGITLQHGGTFSRSSSVIYNGPPGGSTGFNSNGSGWSILQTDGHRVLHKCGPFEPGQMVLKALSDVVYIELYLRLLKAGRLVNGKMPGVSSASSYYGNVRNLNATSPMIFNPPSSTTIKIGGQGPWQPNLPGLTTTVGGGFVGAGGSQYPWTNTAGGTVKVGGPATSDHILINGLEVDNQITEELSEQVYGDPQEAYNPLFVGFNQKVLEDAIEEVFEDAEEKIAEAMPDDPTSVIFSELLMCVSKPFVKSIERLLLVYPSSGINDKTPESARIYDFLENEEYKDATVWQEFWNMENNQKVEICLYSHEPGRLMAYEPETKHKNWKPMSIIKKELDDQEAREKAEAQAQISAQQSALNQLHTNIVTQIAHSNPIYTISSSATVTLTF